MTPTSAMTPATQPEPTSHRSSPTAVMPGRTSELVTDILGEPWVARTIPVTDSPAAPGADHAVLVHQREAVPPPSPEGRPGAPRHERAVLYLHGRNDYFFQTWLADAFLDAGYEFYALDLRACGRAGVGYWSPHDVRDLRVHDEEIAEALRIIRQEHGHSTVVLNGHSTGGLQAVIWAGDHPGSVEAVTLNSPWLQLNSSGLVRSYGSAFIDLLSRRDPDRIIDNPAEIRHSSRPRLLPPRGTPKAGRQVLRRRPTPPSPSRWTPIPGRSKWTSTPAPCTAAGAASGTGTCR
ncbi:alpha/beta hydrolase [Actinomyces ruminis]|uniref:alpha/beta hydrolase n=1 Tax=Actinomyces ruminis TaxID=1937003 RepID=UPI0030B83B38